jgi:hypothetical protein
MRHVPGMMNDAHIVVSNQPYFWITLYIYNLREMSKKKLEKQVFRWYNIILFVLLFCVLVSFDFTTTRSNALTRHVVSNHWNHLYYRCTQYIIFHFHSYRRSFGSYSWLYYTLFVTHSVHTKIITML